MLKELSTRMRPGLRWKDVPPDLRCLLQRYPRSVELNDASRATLRPLGAGDEEALVRLFIDIPYEELRSLHDNVSDPTIVRRWCRNIRYDRVLPIVADLDGRIVADATLHRRHIGPEREVGRFRVYVRPEYRRRGLGTVLLREIMDLARHVGLRELVVELYEDQEALRNVLLSCGFRVAGHVAMYQRVILARDLEEGA